MSGALSRAVRLPGAVLLGLGSILGTGVFVSLGLAAGVTGPSVVLAAALAAAVATFNGLSSAQLAAAHPVSGGTYEYGHRLLNPALGFTAGWMFLCAKSASAATAALGLGGYLLSLLGQDGPVARVGVGLGAVAVLTLLVAGGIRRSNRANAVIVSFTLLALVAFVVAGAPEVSTTRFEPFFEGSTTGLLHATALLFVAYTGYGRIATMGEEIVDPARNIPRAIVATLLASLVLYVAVLAVGVGAVGAGPLAEATRAGAAPLAEVAGTFDAGFVAPLVTLAALTAMLGVLLNLLLGLSRVLLAMARRAEMPTGLAHVEGDSPRRAVFVIGGLIAALVLVGDVKATWSFSAFTVLVYYALTNLAALRLPAAQRLFPRWISAAGLGSCLSLAWFVEARAWIAGLVLLLVGLGWQRVARVVGRRQA